MFLGRVQGHVVATQKDRAIGGQRLLIVEPLKVQYDKNGGGDFDVTNRAIVAVDRIGAGEGQLVLVVQGSSARLTAGCNQMPIDAVIVGLVDSAEVLGEQIDLSQVSRL